MNRTLMSKGGKVTMATPKAVSDLHGVLVALEKLQDAEYWERREALLNSRSYWEQEIDDFDEQELRRMALLVTLDVARTITADVPSLAPFMVCTDEGELLDQFWMKKDAQDYAKTLTIVEPKKTFYWVWNAAIPYAESCF
jgi:hypothetical protein